MKVAMISRATLFSSPGGDTVQMLNTAKSLKEFGVDAEIKLSIEKIEYNEYDLLHFFNIIRPADILSHALKAYKPYVISPVFVDYSEYENKVRRGLYGSVLKMLAPNQQEYIKAVGRSFVNGEKIASVSYFLRGQNSSIKKILKGASLLLPNSVSEYKRLSVSYSMKNNFVVIPNGIDKNIFTGSTEIKDEKLVLCASRIEGRKNQLNLIRALNGTEFKLLIIGSPSPNHQAYYEACKNEAMNNIKFLPAISQLQLAPLYSRAKIHALPSWFETTGLSSLEAAAMGCNIVITQKGDTYEYFGDDAFYCEPEDIASIRKAIESAAAAPVNEKLKAKIFSEYTWSHAAEKTKRAYQTVVGRKIPLLTAEQ